VLPGVAELAEGKVSIGDLREVSIKDLLRRDSVEGNKDLLGKNITNKVVVVTGAGGSIGSELCRQIVFGSVLNRVGSPPSCGHPLITRYSGGLEWGSG